MRIKIVSDANAPHTTRVSNADTGEELQFVTRVSITVTKWGTRALLEIFDPALNIVVEQWQPKLLAGSGAVKLGNIEELEADNEALPGPN